MNEKTVLDYLHESLARIDQQITYCKNLTEHHERALKSASIEPEQARAYNQGKIDYYRDSIKEYTIERVHLQKIINSFNNK